MSRPENSVQYSPDVLDAADPRAQAFTEHDASRNSMDEVLDNWAQQVSPRVPSGELGKPLPGDEAAGLRVQVSSRVENSQQYLTVPDYRTPADKLGDFVHAAARRASNPESYRAYLQQELDKLTGVGEGLNAAKEDVKSAGAAAWKAVTDGTAEKEITSSAAVGWKALTDGTVAKFLARPNAINDPLFHTVGNALNAIPKDPEGARCALEALGKSIQQASDRYSALPAREQGRVIGKLAFYMFAPEAAGAATITKTGIEVIEATGADIGITEGAIETPGIVAAKQSAAILESTDIIVKPTIKAEVTGKLLDVVELSQKELSPTELEQASPELLEAMRRHGRDIVIAQPGSDEMRYLEHAGILGSSNGPNSILLTNKTPKITALEEFLHGTQSRHSIMPPMPAEIAEFRVKRFMITHASSLRLHPSDLPYLEALKAKSFEEALQRGFTPFEIEAEEW